MDQPLLGEVLAKIGGVAALIVIVFTAAWQLFKHLTSKWMENRFAERLKNLEQQHDRAVRHLQSSIDRELDRARKLNAQEFDTLSEGWAVLHDAYWCTRDFTGRRQTYHDFESISLGQAASIIQSSGLADWQKDEVLALADPAERTTYFRRAIGWIALSQTQSTRQTLVTFIDRKAIFMLPQIRALFDRIEVMVSAALIEIRIHLEMPHARQRSFAKHEILAGEGEALYRELEKLIRERLWTFRPLDEQGAV